MELLAAAANPMIMVGGGAVAAGAELGELAELLQAPVVPFRSGRGIVPDDAPTGSRARRGTGLQNPDFGALAASYGVAAYRAETPDELGAAVAAALGADAPALVVVPVERGSEVSPWEFLMPDRR